MNSMNQRLLLVFLTLNSTAVLCSISLLPSVPTVIRKLLRWHDDPSHISFIQRSAYLKSWFAEQELEELCEPIKKILDKLAELVRIFQQIDTPTETVDHNTIEAMFVSALLSQVHDLMIQPEEKSTKTLPEMLTEFDSAFVLCDLRQPVQMYLLGFFEYLATVELLGNELLQHLLRSTGDYQEGEIGSIIQALEASSIGRIRKYFDLMTDVLPKASRDLIVCNPYNYSRGSTFIEMEGFQQLIIVKANESCDNVNNRTGIKPCRIGKNIVKVEQEVPFWHWSLSLRNYCQPVVIGRECTGPVIGCHDMPPDRYYYISASKNSWKRWDVVLNSSRQPIMGKNGKNKPHRTLGKIALNSRDCLCTCIDNGARSRSKHKISLILSESDWRKNKIVVGVRFRRQERILYIQVKEGTLRGNGYITDESWIEPRGIRRKVYVLNEKTGFDLDDVILSNTESVVVGVGFTISAKSDRVSIAISFLPYNYASGYLSSEVPLRLLLHGLDNPKELPVFKKQLLRIPVGQPTIYDSIAGVHFLKLTPSDARSDGGQSTYPFFDARNVEGKPGFIVAGVGIYHQATAESAGIISLKIVCLNYTKLIAESF